MSTNSEPEKHQLERGRSPWLPLGILSVIGFVVMYVETMIVPAIPIFISELHVSYSTVSWVLSSYMIAAAVSTPILGKLSDVYGRKRILLIGLSVYAAAVFACGFATNFEFVVITRIIQGTGIGIFPIAMAIIRNEFSREKIGIAQGIVTTMFASGATVGLAAGGIVVDNLGWRATFFTIVPVPIIIAILIAVLLRERSAQNHAGTGKRFSLDIRGIAALSVAITSFISAFSLLGSGSNLAASLVLLSTGAVSSALFAVIEKRVKVPLIEPRLLFDRVLLASNLLRMSSGVIIFMMSQTIPVLVQSPAPLGFGGTALTSGLVAAPMTAAYLVVGLSVGFVLYRLGNLRVAVMGGALGVASFAYLYLGSLSALPLVLIAVGAAAQLMHLGGTNLNLVSAPKEHTGISFAISNVFYLTGCALGPTLAALFMESHLVAAGSFAAKFPSPESYHLIFAAGIGVSLVVVAASLWASRMRNRQYAS